MAFLSLIGVSLWQLSSEALGELGGSLFTGVSGNFAHELTKASFRSLVRRTQLGQLAANHDLQRAVRRASLFATAVAVAHYRQDLLRSEKARQHWCDTLHRWLREEIEATHRPDYSCPAAPGQTAPDVLLLHVEGPRDAARSELHQRALADVREELRAWHQGEMKPSRLRLETPPAAFEQRLTGGWPSREPATSMPSAWLKAMTKRRGHGAKMAARAADARATQAPSATRTTWFELFAGFFAEELKKDSRAHAIFDARMLSELKQREPGAAALDPEKLVAAFSAALNTVSARILGEIAALRIAVESGQQQLVRAIDAGFTRLEAAVVDRDGAHIPRQLPRRATAEKFFGRKKILGKLARRLAKGRPVAVVGPAGYGKTALAAEAVRLVIGADAAALVLSPFPDGVVVLDLYLAGAAAEPVWTHLANSLRGPKFMPDAAPKLRATEACRARRALVIIEGAECADGQNGAATLTDLLAVLSPENGRLVLTRDSSQVEPAQALRLSEPLSGPEAAALLDRIVGGRLTGEVRSQILALLEGHPLALTWAGSLVARADTSPEWLVSEWVNARLPSLHEPTNAEHSLRWLFERSTRRLSRDAQTVLFAAGLLAPAAFPLSLISAVMKKESAARETLGALVRAHILRPSPTRAEHWEFVHALAYRFVCESRPVDPALARALAGGLRSDLMGLFAPGLGSDAPATARRPLEHAAALLQTDHAGQLWDPLTKWLLYDASDRLAALGRLDLQALALAAIDKWLKARPASEAENLLWERERSVVTNRLGDLAIAQGRLADAEHYFAADLAIARRLVRSNPAVPARERDLFAVAREIDILAADRRNVVKAGGPHDPSVSRENPGDAANIQRKLLDPARVSSADLVLRKPVADSAPANADALRNLSITHERRGDLARAQGRLPEAEREFLAALLIRESLAKSHPARADWQRDLSIACNKLGDLAVAQGRFPSAKRRFSAALAIRERLAQAAPENRACQRDLSVSHERMGDLAFGQNRLAEAERHFSAVLALRQPLARSDPANAEWQHDLAIAHERLGALARARREFAAAGDHFSAALDIARRLAGSEPANAAWQRDLSIAHNKLGDLAKAQEKISDAHRHYSSALDLRQRLAASDSKNALWQRDLSWSLTAMAQLEETRGQPAAALAFARSALAIDARLAALDQTNIVWQDDLRVSRALVARLEALAPPSAPSAPGA